MGKSLPKLPENLSEQTYDELYEQCLEILYNSMRLIGTVPILTEINFSTDEPILFTDKCLHVISVIFRKNLLKLNLGSWKKITDEGIFLITGKCKSLAVIDLSNNLNLTDESLYSFATDCIEHVVDKSDGIKAKIKPANEQISDLKRLNLNGCTNISNLGIYGITFGCNNLTYINVKNTHVTLLEIKNASQSNVELDYSDKMFIMSNVYSTLFK